MAQLAAATRRAYYEGDDITLNLKAAVTVYEGAVLGYNSGAVRQLVAGDLFAGVSLETRTGGAADGDVKIKVRRRGRTELPLASVAAGDAGKRVYASDSNTATLTESTNSAIGVVVAVVTTNVALVAFDADQVGLEQIALHTST